MSKRLSKAQRKRYLARQGLYCPYCDSQELDTLGKPEVDAIEVMCTACRETWWDIYTLTDIQEERRGLR
jgi:Zn ribbon nucleic-acid-binding protein